MNNVFIRKSIKSSNINNSLTLKEVFKRIEELNLNMDKKEDDIKNLINEKDNIIQEMNNKLLIQEKEINKYKTKIENLKKEIKEINNNIKKKDDIINEINNKLLNQNENINDNNNKIGTLYEKINELFFIYNNFDERIQENKDEIKFLKTIISDKCEQNYLFHNNIMPNIGTNYNMNNNNRQNIGIQHKYNDNQSHIDIKKKNIIFKTLNGEMKSIICENGTTISNMIKKYLMEIGNTGLINAENINFTFNAKKISINDNTKIEEYFQNIQSPIIQVYI